MRRQPNHDSDSHFDKEHEYLTTCFELRCKTDETWRVVENIQVEIGLGTRSIMLL